MSVSLCVLGGSGELGKEAVKKATEAKRNGENLNVVATYFNNKPNFAEYNGVSINWTKLDLGDHCSVSNYLKSIQNLIGVIYCAMPKNPGAAAKASDTLKNGIVEDVVFTANVVGELGASIIAISTDQVFNGKKAKPGVYTEDDPVSAYLPYGMYKVEMEKQLIELKKASNYKIYIARSSLILTCTPEPGKCIDFVLNAMKTGNEDIILFTDELRNMSFSCDLGAALVEMILLSENNHDKIPSIVHLACSEITNRYELAKLICQSKRLGNFGNFENTGIRPGLSSETNLNRPLNLGLDTSIIQNILSTKIRGITEYFS